LLLFCSLLNRLLLAVFPLRLVQMLLLQLAEWHIEAVVFDLKALDSALGLHRQQFTTAASGAKKHL
jgi:hypothetical protein